MRGTHFVLQAALAATGASAFSTTWLRRLASESIEALQITMCAKVDGPLDPMCDPLINVTVMDQCDNLQKALKAVTGDDKDIVTLVNKLITMKCEGGCGMSDFLDPASDYLKKNIGSVVPFGLGILFFIVAIFTLPTMCCCFNRCCLCLCGGKAQHKTWGKTKRGFIFGFFCFTVAVVVFFTILTFPYLGKFKDGINHSLCDGITFAKVVVKGNTENDSAARKFIGIDPAIATFNNLTDHIKEGSEMVVKIRTEFDSKSDTLSSALGHFYNNLRKVVNQVTHLSEQISPSICNGVVLGKCPDGNAPDPATGCGGDSLPCTGLYLSWNQDPSNNVKSILLQVNDTVKNGGAQIVDNAENHLKDKLSKNSLESLRISITEAVQPMTDFASGISKNFNDIFVENSDIFENLETYVTLGVIILSCTVFGVILFSGFYLSWLMLRSNFEESNKKQCGLAVGCMSTCTCATLVLILGGLLLFVGVPTSKVCLFADGLVVTNPEATESSYQTMLKGLMEITGKSNATLADPTQIAHTCLHEQGNGNLLAALPADVQDKLDVGKVLDGLLANVSTATIPKMSEDQNALAALAAVRTMGSTWTWDPSALTTITTENSGLNEIFSAQDATDIGICSPGATSAHCVMYNKIAYTNGQVYCYHQAAASNGHIVVTEDCEATTYTQPTGDVTFYPVQLFVNALEELGSFSEGGLTQTPCFGFGYNTNKDSLNSLSALFSRGDCTINLNDFYINVKAAGAGGPSITYANGDQLDFLAKIAIVYGAAMERALLSSGFTCLGAPSGPGSPSQIEHPASGETKDWPSVNCALYQMVPNVRDMVAVPADSTDTENEGALYTDFDYLDTTASGVQTGLLSAVKGNVENFIVTPMNVLLKQTNCEGMGRGFRGTLNAVCFYTAPGLTMVAMGWILMGVFGALCAITQFFTWRHLRLCTIAE